MAVVLLLLLLLLMLLGTTATSVIVEPSSSRCTSTPVAARDCLGMPEARCRTITPAVVDSRISSASETARKHAKRSGCWPALALALPILPRGFFALVSASAAVVATGAAGVGAFFLGFLNLVAITQSPPRRPTRNSLAAHLFPYPFAVTTRKSASSPLPY